MFGFEFSEKHPHYTFPSYCAKDAILSDKITEMVPLVWQEHCVECGMPACYSTCPRYQKRSDGRCLLFKHGIERVKNPEAILGQNAVIEMRQWAKLETFFFPNRLTYKSAKKLNGFFVFLANIGRWSNCGKIRRLCYYGKEFISRKVGNKVPTPGTDLPKYLLIELLNQDTPYSLALENHANNQVVYRTNLTVKSGYNRFLIPTSDLRFQEGTGNTLCIYSNENRELTLHIISLEMVSFDPEYEKTIVPKNNKKVKLVVWDLDHTLWDGILSEEGIGGITLKPEIVEIIRDLDQKGIINSIASKNDYEKVLPVLKEFGLEEYFISPMINWNPKSGNIKAIAKSLDLGIDTFVFVDDTPNELQEVLTNCPGIRVCNVANITEYIKDPAFDVPVTAESRNRRKMYQEASLRNQSELQFENNIDEFLKDCQMVMHVSHPGEEEVERCYELLQRTNQLNISAQRLSRDELEALLSSDNHDCYRIKVNDKYGDYGLVGFAVFEKADTETVVLKHFVFSCRAARKKLEPFFFKTMLDLYKAQGYKTLSLVCKKTERNALMQSVLISCGLFEKTHEHDSNFMLTASMDAEHPYTDIATLSMD